MTRLIAALAVLSLLLLAGPAGAFTDEERELEFVESTAYLTPTTTGVSNIDTLATGEAIGWTEEAPTGDLAGRTLATSHAGLGSILLGDEFFHGQSLIASGTTTGLLENISLALYYESPTDNMCGMGLSVDLTIDGVPVMDMEGIGNTEDVSTIQAGDYWVTELGLVNIHEAMVTAGIAGDETTEHTIDLSAVMYPICQEAIWTYGTADAPSSLTFNVDPDSGGYRFLTKWDVTSPPQPAEA